MGRLRPQHSLTVRRQSDRQQYRFLLSGFTDSEKSTLAASITKLGGKYVDSKVFVPDCSHIVSVRPMRSEKYLCGCAAGKWIVTPDYITSSVAAGQWLEEQPYIWGSDKHASTNQFTPSMADAPQRWIKRFQQTNQRAFSGWTVAILVSSINNRPAVYKRLIEYGGGVVLSLKGAIKDPDDLGKLLDYIFVDKCFEGKVRPLKARGVSCLAPEFIAEYLFEQTPNEEKYEIGNYTVEPKEKRKADAGNLRKTVQSTLKVDITQHAKSSPKQYTQEINSSFFESLEFTSSSQSTLSQSSSLSSASLLNSVKRINGSTLPQSPLTSSPLTPAGPRPCGQTICTEADSSTSDVVVKRKLAFSPSVVEETVSNVKQKHNGSAYSRVPYWMQVRPPKYGNDPKVATPFPRVISSLIEAHLEEDFWLRAVHSIHAHLTAKKYPPPSLLHVVMSKITESTDDAFKNHAINLLKSVLCLHPPSTPDMSQVYFQSFVPADDNLFGLENDDPINTPWDFIGSVIRKSLQRPLNDETDPKDSQMHYTALRHSSELLLGYIVALLEQDFQAYTYRKENPQLGVRKTHRCMLSQVLWPNHRLGVSNPTVRQLISFLLQAVAVTEETASMYPCLRMVISLVELAAECCRINTGDSSMLSSLRTGIHVDLAAEIASMAAQEGLPDNTQSLNILLSLLQPDWLKLRVAESLLNSYDDSLVSDEHRQMAGKPLSLKKVVAYYFYLVPPTAKSISTSETPKSTQEHKPNSKRPCHQETTNVVPLKTKATRNMISKTQQETIRINGQQVAKLNNKVNQKNMRGETRLHLACIKNDVAEVRKLLACPAIKVNLCDYAGWTPLHEAANHGHVACVKELLKYRPRQKITSYFMPEKNTKCLDFLDLVAAPAECGTTPLHDAVTNGHVEVARLLVQAGGKAVLTARNKAGLAALNIAISDAMKCALELNGKNSTLDENHNKENICTNSRGQKRPSNQQGTPAKRLCTGKNDASPSEERYASVLGPTQNPKTFVTAEKCEQYCLLVCHLLQACLRTHKLVAIKAGLHEHQELPATSDETTDSEPTPSVEYVMANASPPRNGCDTEVDCKDTQNTSSSGRLLMEDLNEMGNLENHLEGFVNHLGRLGPWVGSQRSDVCDKIIREMKILVETCL